MILAWWRQDDLFLDHDAAEPRNIETGLALLAQVGMLLEDLRWFDGESGYDGPLYLSKSWLSDADVREDIAEALEVQSMLHADLLRNALPDVGADMWRDEYAVDDPFDIIPEDSPTERLTAALDTQPTNAMQDIVDEGVTNQSKAVATQKALRHIRLEQNKLNLEAFGTPHPPKPTAGPVHVPEFEDLHEETSLTPRRIPPTPTTTRRRKKKPLAQPDVVLRVPRNVPAEPIENAPSGQADQTSRGRGKRKRVRSQASASDQVQDDGVGRERKKRNLRSGRVENDKPSYSLRSRAGRTVGASLPSHTYDALSGNDDLSLRTGDHPATDVLIPVTWDVCVASESEPDTAEDPGSRTVVQRDHSGSGVRLQLGEPIRFSVGAIEADDADVSEVRPVSRPRPRRPKAGSSKQPAGPSTNFS